MNHVIPQKVTSLEVAKRAGVSQSAVSRVFSGASASQTTVDKVRTAADELGYRPNALARSLITGKSRIIGVVVAYLENQFYPVALEALSHRLRAEGYHILLRMTGRDQVDADQVVEDLLAHQVDGIIAASVTLSEKLTDVCRNAGVPIVLFNRGSMERGVSQVTSDNFDGAGQVADHLYDTGHRRIVHVSGWLGSATGRDRAAGVATRLEELGVPLKGQADGRYAQSDAARVALDLMDQHAPDAIFVGNDHMAFAVIDALKGRGVTIGSDISVVGYDDVPMSAWPSFDLTTMRQPLRRMVDATVDHIISSIQSDTKGPMHTTLKGDLIVRGSTRKDTP